MTDKTHIVHCPMCLGTGERDQHSQHNPDHQHDPDNRNWRCPNCAATISYNNFGIDRISVEGSNADEVMRVARKLTAGQRQQETQRRETAVVKSPWVSGVFYLTALFIVVALLLVIGSVLALWALPVIIVGAVLLLSVVGAFQMRQDEKLSEKGFLRLMSDTLTKLPLLFTKRDNNSDRPET